MNMVRQAYADGVALAPDLPAVYYSWGVALDKHGDLDGAVAKLLEANRCGRAAAAKRAPT